MGGKRKGGQRQPRPSYSPLRDNVRGWALRRELGDFEPEEDRLADLLHLKVGLKLWYFYYQNSEVKHSSLYFSGKHAFDARRKLKPLIKYLNSQVQG